jgi:hypothetical protein
MLYVVSDVLKHNRIEVDAIRQLGLCAGLADCHGFHDVVIDRSLILEWIRPLMD